MNKVCKLYQVWLHLFKAYILRFIYHVRIYTCLFYSPCMEYFRFGRYLYIRFTENFKIIKTGVNPFIDRSWYWRVPSIFRVSLPFEEKTFVWAAKRVLKPTNWGTRENLLRYVFSKTKPTLENLELVIKTVLVY